MQLRQLLRVIWRDRGAFILWLLGNIGGLLIAYLASLTIWYFHGNLGRCVPGPEVILITGTISLAIAGVSYVRLHSDDPTISLSPILSLTWPFPVMFVYGVLVSMGIETNVRSITAHYSLAIIILIICLTWATLTWAHERGIRQEMQEEPEPPSSPEMASENLPKYELNEGDSE